MVLMRVAARSFFKADMVYIQSVTGSLWRRGHTPP